MNNINKSLVIGLITRPHGIKGELCVQYYAESPLLFKAPVFLVSPEDKIIECKVLKSKKAKDHFIIQLENCNDRDKAENFRDYEICIDPIIMRDFLHKHAKSSQQTNTEEEVFVYQLTGLEVYISQDYINNYPQSADCIPENTKKTNFLGILKKVDFISAQEMWFIYTDKKQEILFPAIPHFVESIDLKENKVIINPPEGLIEVYLG